MLTGTSLRGCGRGKGREAAEKAIGVLPVVLTGTRERKRLLNWIEPLLT
jgi:hypothetical protein